MTDTIRKVPPQHKCEATEKEQYY